MSSKTKFIDDLRCERLEVGDGWAKKKLAPTTADEVGTMPFDTTGGNFQGPASPGVNEIYIKIVDDVLLFDGSYVGGTAVAEGTGSYIINMNRVIPGGYTLLDRTVNTNRAAVATLDVIDANANIGMIGNLVTRVGESGVLNFAGIITNTASSPYESAWTAANVAFPRTNNTDHRFSFSGRLLLKRTDG